MPENKKVLGRFIVYNRLWYIIESKRHYIINRSLVEFLGKSYSKRLMSHIRRVGSTYEINEKV